MVPKLFLHGVPDSPAIWRPLMQALEWPAERLFTPALPGFDAALPAGFTPHKDRYVDWLIGKLDAIYGQFGPVDVVGHDWGALIVQRAAMVRPELFRSWVISNAVIDPEYRGHRMARIWSTPILGELFMMLSRPKQISDLLIAQGVPADIAAEEAEQWRLPDKRSAILKLYRSAAGLSFARDWAPDIGLLPPHGMLLWGENDPYVPLGTAQRYSEQTGTKLQVIPDTGHWAIATRPTEISHILKDFWSFL